MSPPAPRPFNATAASILGFLRRGPQTGWDLASALASELGDFWSVTRSQVYRELKALEEQGHIVAGPVEARDRRPYTLTDQGSAAFDGWLATLPGDDIVRVPLLLTLFFSADLDDGTVGRFLEAHRAVHEERLAGYRAVVEVVAAVDDEEHRRLAWVLDYGIRHTEAVLEWMAALPFPDKAS